MFAHHCTACDRRQLVFPDQVTGLVNTDHGIVLGYRCWCGSEQRLVAGAHARRPRLSVAA